MKPRDIRDLSADELGVKIREMSRDLSSMKLKHRSGVAIERPMQIKHLRRDIARMKTISAEREKLA